MASKYRRKPKNYDGTEVTSRKMTDLLPGVLSEMGDLYKDRPDLIVAGWADLIGPKFAPMAQAVSFIDGVLLVKVTNSTLYSLLSQQEKFKLLQKLRQKFPQVDVKNIFFRIG